MAALAPATLASSSSTEKLDDRCVPGAFRLGEKFVACPHRDHVSRLLEVRYVAPLVVCECADEPEDRAVPFVQAPARDDF